MGGESAASLQYHTQVGLGELSKRLPGEACGAGIDSGLGAGGVGPSSEGGGRLAISRVRLLTGNWEKEM